MRSKSGVRSWSGGWAAKKSERIAAAIEALMPRSLHRVGGGGLRVRARQPRAEIVRGFVRSAAIERHHRVGHAGNSDDAGAPAIRGDARDLDQVWSSTNGFFVTMDGRGHRFCERVELSGTIRIVVRSARRSSEAIRENARTDRRGEVSDASASDKYFRRQCFNRKSTEHQQVLHTANFRAVLTGSSRHTTLETS